MFAGERMILHPCFFGFLICRSLPVLCDGAGIQFCFADLRPADGDFIVGENDLLEPFDELLVILFRCGVSFIAADVDEGPG